MAFHIEATLDRSGRVLRYDNPFDPVALRKVRYCYRHHMQNSDRQHAVDLIGHLDNSQLAAVVQLLEVMAGPVMRSIAEAPFEVEELSSEMADELDAAAASPAREVMSHDDLLRRFRARAALDKSAFVRPRKYVIWDGKSQARLCQLSSAKPLLPFSMQSMTT